MIIIAISNFSEIRLITRYLKKKESDKMNTLIPISYSYDCEVAETIATAN